MKKKYSALPELLLRSIFYTLINYVLEECKVDKRLDKLQNIIEKYVVGKF